MEIALAEVLEVLRDELNKAEAKKDPNKPLIIEEAEVELQVVVTKGVKGTGEAEAKTELKVLDFFKLGDITAKLSGEAHWEKAATHKIRLKLSVGEVGADGKTKKRKFSTKQ